MLLIAGTVVAMLVVVGAINSRAIRQLYRAAKAQIGRLGGYVEAATPLASYQLRIDEFSAAVEAGKVNLEKYKGLIHDKQTRLEELYTTKSGLERRIELTLQNFGKERAVKDALKLSSVQKDIAKVEEEVEKFSNTYEAFRDKLTKDQQMINDIKEEAKQLDYELQQSKAEAALADFVPQKLDSGLLQADRNRIKAAINANRGKVDVALDMADDDYDLDNDIKQLEHNQEANEILSRFIPQNALTDQSESRILETRVVETEKVSHK